MIASFLITSQLRQHYAVIQHLE